MDKKLPPHADEFEDNIPRGAEEEGRCQSENKKPRSSRIGAAWLDKLRFSFGEA